jgi:hypothetical protein
VCRGFTPVLQKLQFESWVAQLRTSQETSKLCKASGLLLVDQASL